MLVVIAKLTAAPGKGDELAPKLAEMVEWVTENEAATLTYICTRSQQNPDEFVFFERYADHTALTDHMGSAQFKKFGKETAHLFAGPPQVQMLDEVAAKL